MSEVRVGERCAALSVGQWVVLYDAPADRSIGRLMVLEDGYWLVGITGSLQSHDVTAAGWYPPSAFAPCGWFSESQIRLARLLAGPRWWL